MNKIHWSIYLLVGVLGLGLVVIDVTPGHATDGHLIFLSQNIDAVLGIILLWFSGWGLGRSLKAKK